MSDSSVWNAASLANMFFAALANEKMNKGLVFIIKVISGEKYFIHALE